MVGIAVRSSGNRARGRMIAAGRHHSWSPFLWCSFGACRVAFGNCGTGLETFDCGLRLENSSVPWPPVLPGSLRFMATCAAIAPVSPVCMPSVEPGLKPYHPKPERKGAQHHQGQVVALKLLGVLEATLAWAEHDSACQSTHATRQVHDGAARKIHVALVVTRPLAT